ncbi:Uncharacterized protein APZ42_020487 [Daphnia magna]|uniref:Secreted protein n=1 Tax=Daphnia magna TaxID=35525 RepID=A0A164XGE5_9CRUS|nr:Uncharacterized protein APZ42_020487 [Daphnia magna]
MEPWPRPSLPVALLTSVAFGTECIVGRPTAMPHGQQSQKYSPLVCDCLYNGTLSVRSGHLSILFLLLK